jgi:mono/diheme cytochrome c family protein
MVLEAGWLRRSRLSISQGDATMVIRAFVISAALALLGTPISPAEDKIDFEKQIQPILVEHCAKCHGADKNAGKLRLNTAAAIGEKLAADPKLLVAGKPEESEIYQRITLPAENPKRMPKMADPLPKETIEFVGNWIKQGAVLPAVAAVATPAPAEKPTEPAAPAEKAKPPEEPKLPEVPPAPKEAIDKLTAANAQVVPLFGGSSLLAVSFAHRDQPAGDAEIALLSGVAEQVYALDLAGAKPTDAGLAPLGALKNLSALHLELSSISDEGLAHLAGLGGLQYLNLYGTGITDAGLKHLAALKQLQKLYLWQTKTSYDAAMALEKDTPGLMVNLGYNHPVVAKMRLTKEMEVAKKQAEEAKADAAKVEQQLQAAKKNVEAVDARVAEIDKQLKALEAPADAKDAKPEDKPAAKPEDKAADKPADKPAEKAEAKPEEKPAPTAEPEKKEEKAEGKK